MVSKFIIYALVDPRSKQWRYIGKSSKGLDRPKQHAKSWNLQKYKRTHKACWILQLQSLGLNYEIEILEELLGPDKLYEAEHEWIKAARLCGVDLTNGTDGGAGPSGFHHYEETKELLRMKAIKQFSDPENLQRHAENTRKRFTDPEQRQKRRESAVVAMENPANRVKISRTLGGTPVMDDLGRVFPTINAAARANDTYSSAIRKVLKGELRTTAGRTFVRCEEQG